MKQMPLKHAKIGDALVFERVGAYSVTEGIYFPEPTHAKDSVLV